MNPVINDQDAEAVRAIERRLRRLAPRHRISHLEALLRRAAIGSGRQRLLWSLLSDETGPRNARGERA